MTNRKYIHYSIDELVGAENECYLDKDDDGKSIQVERKNSYLLRDSGCSCCSSEERFTRKGLIKLIEKSIVQLQDKILQLEGD